jgi:hypothetical protein
VQARGDKSAERLKHYAKFVEWLKAEFAEVDDINASISALHARAPTGEQRRLLDVELVARGLTNFSRVNPPLRENLKLPKWDRSSEVAYPPDALDEFNRRAAQMNAALTQRMIAKNAFTSGPDWAAGRDLAFEQETAEFAKRADELRATETKSKVEYEARLQEAERRRLTGE